MWKRADFTTRWNEIGGRDRSIVTARLATLARRGLKIVTLATLALGVSGILVVEELVVTSASGYRWARDILRGTFGGPRHQNEDSDL
jgi:hypothetical protein